MSWSTREVADLAGTTVNTVRHYHRVGLLQLPERTANGYKRYEVAHLVRLLQVLRLRDIGVPLGQIDEVGAGGTPSPKALETIDADLAASIERLQRARAEIAAILDGTTTTDVPAGFESIAKNLSHQDRALMLIYSRLYDEEAMADLRTMLERERDAASVELDSLGPDADRATKDRLAAELAPELARDFERYPWMLDPFAHLLPDQQISRDVFVASVSALYNKAQMEVIAHASAIASEGILDSGERRSVA